MAIKLHDLKKKRADLRTELKTLKGQLMQKLEDLPLGDEETPDIAELHGRVKDCESAINDHDERIGKMEDAIDTDGGGAKPPGEGEDGDKRFGIGGNSGNWTPFGYGEKQREQGKGFKAARFAFGKVVEAKHGLANAQQYVERVLQDKEVAKALNTTGVATGGALIPQAFSQEIIELLRADTVFMESNPEIYEMPGGNLTIPRLAAGATAGYQGELDDMSASQETFDDVQLNAKKLTALVPVSNDLLRRASQNLERIIRDDMTATMARRLDLAAYLGDGSGTSPIGLLNQCSALAKIIAAPFAATDNATILTQVTGILQAMVLTLENSFSRMRRVRWTMTPTTEKFLMGLRDNVGNFVYKEEMEKGTLWGYPYKKTQQFPTNLSAALLGGGTANDGTYLFLADYADVIFADTYNMIVDASDVASYKDGGGNMVSAWTRDQTAFRVISEHDIALRHQASVAVALLPAWAPPGWTGYSAGAAFYVQAPSGDMSAAPSTWGIASPTGSNNPGNASANAPGGTQPGRI